VLYKFSKCPYCGASIDSFKQTGLNDMSEDVGSPTAMCMSCFKSYKTGRQYWSEMDGAARFIVYLRLAFGAVVGGFFFGVLMFIAFMLLNGFFKWTNDNEDYRMAILICLPLGFIFSVWTHWAQLADLKRLSDKDTNAT
jgi:hypothetical protein